MLVAAMHASAIEPEPLANANTKAKSKPVNKMDSFDLKVKANKQKVALQTAIDTCTNKGEKSTQCAKAMSQYKELTK